METRHTLPSVLCYIYSTVFRAHSVVVCKLAFPAGSCNKRALSPSLTLYKIHRGYSTMLFYSTPFISFYIYIYFYPDFLYPRSWLFQFATQSSTPRKSHWSHRNQQHWYQFKKKKEIIFYSRNSLISLCIFQRYVPQPRFAFPTVEWLFQLYNADLVLLYFFLHFYSLHFLSLYYCIRREQVYVLWIFQDHHKAHTDVERKENEPNSILNLQ